MRPRMQIARGIQRCQRRSRQEQECGKRERKSFLEGQAPLGNSRDEGPGNGICGHSAWESLGGRKQVGAKEPGAVRVQEGERPQWAGRPPSPETPRARSHSFGVF